MKLKLEKYFIETKKVPSFTFFSAYQFSRTTNQPKSQTLNSEDKSLRSLETVPLKSSKYYINGYF